MTARSFKQEQREYEMIVSGFIYDPPDNDFQLGYAVRAREEMLARGYVTLARELNAAIEPYRREWLKAED